MSNPHRLIPVVLVVLAAGRGLAQSGKTLVYADFDKVESGRPVSARGGPIVLTSYQESDVHKTTVKGAAGVDPPAPELVRLKEGDPNHAMKFEYALMAPNQWAGASVEIHGQPDADGRPVADDVSGYKELSLQLYATGIEAMRIEFRSKGQGADLQTGHPQMTFKVRAGLNTYRVPLRAIAQPTWVEIRVDPKDVLKKLTSITITAYCEQCRPAEGMVVIDNVSFDK